MTDAPQVLERTGTAGEVSMEFLHARPDLGEAGPTVGKVQVEHHPGGTFVRLGVQGKMDHERVREGIARVRDWLRDHGDEWVQARPPRELGYHGPMTRQDRRLWEAQLPVKPTRAPGGMRAGDRLDRIGSDRSDRIGIPGPVRQPPGTALKGVAWTGLLRPVRGEDRVMRPNEPASG